MPGLPKSRTSERAEPHVRLRPRGLEPHPGLAAGPLLRRADRDELRPGQRLPDRPEGHRAAQLARRERSLARYQRRLARCQQGSANRAKARAKVARAHRKVRASRADFLHRTSTRLVRDHDVIVIEDLNVSGLVRNRSLAKAISDSGWGTFRRMLEYKAARAGRQLIVTDRFYPSSKICSECGHLLTELTLNVRAWSCPSCGTRHDRDVNAAKNILAVGLAVAACGADVRHLGSSWVRSAVKQEPRPARAGIPVPQGGE